MPRPERRYDLLRKRLDVFARMLPGVEAGDVRALHRARVASRRLRELIPVLELDSEAAAKLGRRLRRVTAGLGGVRELDVLLELTAELDSSHPRRAVEQLRSAIERERADARAALTDRRTMAELRRVARKLRDILDSIRPTAAGRRDAPHAWAWAIDARVAHRAAKLAAAIDAAGTAYVPERLHDVRIALKKFRYALEVAAEARGQPASADVRMLRQRQDLLGRLHDLQMLIARARGVEDRQAGAAGDLGALVDALETDCRHLHARYLRERGALVALCDRVAGAYGRRAGQARIERSA